MHSCHSTLQLSRIRLLKMSLHRDIHSLLNRKGGSQGQGEYKRKKKKRKKTSLQMWSRTCRFCLFVCFHGLRELKLLHGSLRFGLPSFFNMHTKNNNLLLESCRLAELLNKLLEIMWMKKIQSQWRGCLKLHTSKYVTYTQHCLHVLAFNGLQSNDPKQLRL